MARLGDDKPKRDRSNPVNFTAPIDQVRENASSYSERVRRAKDKTAALKGKGKPLGGAPPIPEGKMAQLTMQRPTFEEEETPTSAGVPPPPTGVGASYEVNRKLMGGEYGGPVTISEAREQKRRMSAQTEEVLKIMDKNVREATGKEPLEESEPDASEPEEDTDKDELDKADKELERAGIDLDGIAKMRGSLLSEERRKKIEMRLKPLDIADMVTKREVQQRVPVVPGRMEFVFRTMSQEENIFCLRYVYEFPGSEAHANEVLNTAKLVCSIVSINDAMLHSHMKGNTVDRDEFQKKWDQVVSFPVQLVGDMSVQLIWFNGRINQLFDIGNLKNG